MPLKLFWNILFKIIILNTYKIWLKIKNKKIKKKLGTNIISGLVINKQAVHILIIIACIIILINNLSTKKVLAEDLGKGSLIFQIAQGDEFSEIKEQAINVLPDGLIQTEKFIQSDIETKKTKQFNATSTPSTTLGGIFDTSITKHTQIVLKDQLTDELPAKDEKNIITDALVKQLSPETQTLPKPRQEITTYIVDAGDTISSIAEKFGVSINTILWANKISGLSIIRPGDELTILPISGVSHKVAKNDTLSSIAKTYSVEVEKILEYNQLASADQIQIEQNLIIPGGTIQPQTRSLRSLASVFSSPGSNVGSSSKRISGFIWPTVSKKITQYYNWRHHAIDIGSKTGTAVYASMAGTIIKAGWSTGYGYNIIIDHGGGKRTVYAHLSKIYVEKNQEVNQGDVIGAIGSTGWSTGPHLHFEIIINGSQMNPLSYL